MKQALGLIETTGLIGAVEACDVMLKSANVQLIGKEIVGGGLVTVMIEGDVGAVKTAVDAGSSAVTRLCQNCLLSTHVIPRPDNSLADILPVNANEQQENVLAEEVLIDMTVIDELGNNNTELEEVELVITEDEQPIDIEDIQSSPSNEQPKKNSVKEQLMTFITDGNQQQAKDWLMAKKVSELRVFAKSWLNFPLSKKEVHHVSKRTLVETIITYLSKADEKEE
ncbi:hypothetical protein CBF34_08460 [Vagococcus penaei]|uniref:Uncharacterized protein n=1 Tax=Vagococcus penaei TaxID=633807 RepID=A0A1Q2D645_9ENTE|nr:BMC domain-containing protein [Vagococcus penaei]AQP53757.1 hypothetical protein BW732_05570 [Vagococcus penaei]RSU00412.1 hypothetical protein CBF34_08460 [Vagococcus penaei]